MAYFLAKRNDTFISIPDVEYSDNVTVYHILVRIGNVWWSVPHRYSDFVELHDKLVSDHGVSKDALPPKKVIGNRDPSFIERRRQALAEYLSQTVNFLQLTMPRELALFLNFHKYEIVFLLQSLSLKFFTEGDTLLQLSKSYTFTPLELYAISERIKQPCPSLEIVDKRLDFSHVLDFCCQLTSVGVKGTTTAIETSNIVPNLLPFELSVFKAADKLALQDVCVGNVYNMGILRETVVSLSVHCSELKKIAHVLLCDNIHKDISNTEQNASWKNLIDANFSYNIIEEIDESVKLMPSLKHLNLAHNKTCALSNLTSLPHLCHLDLSANYFESVEDFHMKLGNIVSINLSENSIMSLNGLSKLYSLESLDLGLNKIHDITEIRHVRNLPCLENLNLTGNPVTTILDYRVKVLEQFAKRAVDICLDNEKSTQKELDTVAILQALQIAKEGRTPAFSNEFRPLP